MGKGCCLGGQFVLMYICCYLYLRKCLIRARSGLSVTAVHACALHLVFCVVICDYHSALMGNSGSVYCRGLWGEFCLTGKI